MKKLTQYMLLAILALTVACPAANTANQNKNKSRHLRTAGTRQTKNICIHRGDRSMSSLSTCSTKSTLTSK